MEDPQETEWWVSTVAEYAHRVGTVRNGQVARHVTALIGPFPTLASAQEYASGLMAHSAITPVAVGDPVQVPRHHR